MPDEFQYDVFLSHSAKDKAVVRETAARLREAGLRLWFDELPVAASRQSAANFSEKPRIRKDKDGGALPRRRYTENIEEWLEHSRAVPLAHRMGEGPGVRAANASESQPSAFSLQPLLDASEFGLFRYRTLWQDVHRDLRAVARRMEGVARPDADRAFPPQRRTVRAIPGDGRQP